MKLQRVTLLLLSALVVSAAPSTDHGPRHSSGSGANDNNGPGRNDSPTQVHNGPNQPPPLPQGGGCDISPFDLDTYCASPVNFNATELDSYICGDWRLGPLKLPSMIPLDSFVEFYHRFGALCPGEFITKYWNDSLLPDPYWDFPEPDGWALDATPAHDPIKGSYLLEVGVLVDRFGGGGGRFVAPAASPYIQRALPPNNLDTPQGDPKIPYNYHLYRVGIAFVVEAGPIAPWFEQPGQGVQYHLPDGKTVADLVGSGHLVPEVPLELYAIEADRQR